MTAVSTIGEKTVVTGNIHGDGDLEVHGRVHGDVTVEGSVLVSPTSQVKGSISATRIRVGGSVEGNLIATQTVAIDSEAKVLGDLTTPRISIAEGAVVRGMVRTDAETRPVRPKTRDLEHLKTRDEEREVMPPLAEPVHPAPPVATPDVEPKLVDEKKKGKNYPKRPPEPRVPSLAKGTKGKKKGDKRGH